MTSRTFVTKPSTRDRRRRGWLQRGLRSGGLLTALALLAAAPVAAETTLTAQVGPVMPGRALARPGVTGTGGTTGSADTKDAKDKKEPKKPLTAKERRGGKSSTGITTSTPPGGSTTRP